MSTGRVSFALRTTLWVALTMFLSILNLAFSRTGQADQGPYTLLAFLGAITLPFVLIWRRRFPEIVMTLTLVGCALLPIGSSITWVALGALLRRRKARSWKDPWLWGAAVGTTAVTYLAVARDLGAPTAETSLLGSFLEESTVDPWRSVFPWYTEALVTAILMSMVLGVAILLRARSTLHEVSAEVAGAKSQNVTLSHELARLEERERIARELHDSLGSKLASVSMLSGALRAQPTDAGLVRSHADQLQLTAQEATAEMHEIIRTYRNHPAPATTLLDLDDLLDEARRRGVLIHSHLELDVDSPAPLAVERAVYRVVQEITTNAGKHAPGQMLTLRASGGPARGGIAITASNPIPHAPGAPPPPGPGSSGGIGSTGGAGLIGARERVELLGGWLETKPANGVFEVQAWIPWRVSPTP